MASLEPVGIIDPLGDPFAPPANSKLSRGQPALRWRFARIPGETPSHLLRWTLYLPVVLNDFSFEESAQHTDFTTVRRGQFSQPAVGGSDAPDLMTLTGDTLSLQWDASWLVARSITEDQLRTELFGILRSKRPVELIVTLKSVQELRMQVTMRSLRRVLKQGENDTRYYTMQISRWRSMEVQRRVHTGEGRARGVRLPTTIKLHSSDSLESLSRKYYGTPRYWRQIRDANGITKKWGGSTPLVRMKKFKVGSKLKIPRDVAHEHSPRLVARGTGIPGTARRR